MNSVCWVEPEVGLSGCVKLCIPVKEAIHRQRMALAVNPRFSYNSFTDEQMLEDFIVTHWASVEDGNEKTESPCPPPQNPNAV